LQDVANDISFIANTNSVTGAPSVSSARQSVFQGKAISAGGEENFIFYKSNDGTLNQVFSDADSFSTVNKEANAQLSGLVLEEKVSPAEVYPGADVDKKLYQMQQITQDVLDSAGGDVNVDVMNNIRKAIADQTGITRSYAMYNGVDNTIAGVSADSNVKSLVSNNGFTVPGLEAQVSIDKYNEMVIGIAKEQPGKNSIAVLQQLSNDGKSGTVTIFNDAYPAGKSFRVGFDPQNLVVTSIEEV
jgi:hypothetical protein